MTESNTRNKQEISAKLTERFKKLVSDDLKKELEENIRSIANQIIEEELFEKKADSINNNYEGSKRTKHDNEKVFTPRDSLLTEMLEISHIRTIYHIFVVILILLFLNTMIYDLVDKGSINIGLGLIIRGFGKINYVVLVWCLMETYAFAPFIAIKIWANFRSKFSRKFKTDSSHPKIIQLLLSAVDVKLWDTINILIYIAYHVLFLIFPIYAVLHYALPIASSLIILSEMVRFMMKSHAYVRSISPRILNNSTASLPSFSWYLYFFFAPTLVYRDSYPRTKKMEWSKVFSGLFEVCAIIFYINFLCERFLIHNWANFGSPTEILEAKQMVLTIFGSMLPALLMFTCGFYLLLHSWHNASAEILTFADRRFYMDWWNQSDYGGYYRTWNMVVHDWLYTYIYRDAILIWGKKSVATFLVFFMSAMFHEIILTFAFGFFYPVLLVMFGIAGVFLMIVTKHLNRKIGNVLMWLTLAIGNGFLWSMYSAEYFSRINCPPTIDSKILDLMIPRSWFCHQIVFTPNWKLQNPFTNMFDNDLVQK